MYLHPLDFRSIDLTEKRRQAFEVFAGEQHFPYHGELDFFVAAAGERGEYAHAAANAHWRTWNMALDFVERLLQPDPGVSPSDFDLLVSMVRQLIYSRVRSPNGQALAGKCLVDLEAIVARHAAAGQPATRKE